MDVERTIEFLLEQAAKHDARMEQIEEKLQRTDELLIRGAKMLVSNQEAIRETDRRISALVDAQMKTDQSMTEMKQSVTDLAKSVQTFIDSMRGGNGKGNNGG